MEPILTYSEITGSVYVVTKYKKLKDGCVDAREQYDVTDWVERYAAMRSADLKAENAKLRRLVRRWYPHMYKRVGRDALEQWGQMQVIRDCGIEVDE